MDLADLMPIDNYINQYNTEIVMELGQIKFYDPYTTPINASDYLFVSSDEEYFLASSNYGEPSIIIPPKSSGYTYSKSPTYLYKCIRSSIDFGSEIITKYSSYEMKTYLKITSRNDIYYGLLGIYSGGLQPVVYILNGRQIDIPAIETTDSIYGYGYDGEHAIMIEVTSYTSILKESNYFTVFAYNTILNPDAVEMMYYNYETDDMSDDEISALPKMNISNLKIENNDQVFSMESLHFGSGYKKLYKKNVRISFEEPSNENSLYNVIIKNRDKRFKISRIVRNTEGILKIEKYRDLALVENIEVSYNDNVDTYKYVFEGTIE